MKMLPPFLITGTPPYSYFPTTVESASNPDVHAYWDLPDSIYEDHVAFAKKNNLTERSRAAILHDFYVVANEAAERAIITNDVKSKDLAGQDCETQFDYVVMSINQYRDGAALSGRAQRLEVTPPPGKYVPTDITKFSSDLTEFNPKTSSAAKKADAKKEDESFNV